MVLIYFFRRGVLPWQGLPEVRQTMFLCVSSCMQPRDQPCIAELRVAQDIQAISYIYFIGHDLFGLFLYAVHEIQLFRVVQGPEKAAAITKLKRDTPIEKLCQGAPCMSPYIPVQCTIRNVTPRCFYSVYIYTIHACFIHFFNLMQNVMFLCYNWFKYYIVTTYSVDLNIQIFSCFSFFIGHTAAFVDYFNYCRSLTFSARPSYSTCRRMFRACYDSYNLDADPPHFDWELQHYVRQTLSGLRKYLLH